MVVAAIVTVNITIVSVAIVVANCATIVVYTMIDTGHDSTHKLCGVINTLGQMVP